MGGARSWHRSRLGPSKERGEHENGVVGGPIAAREINLQRMGVYPRCVRGLRADDEARGGAREDKWLGE